MGVIWARPDGQQSGCPGMGASVRRQPKGVPGAAPWGRPCTVWDKWIVGLERVDGTGSRWSEGELSGRTRLTMAEEGA